MTLDSLQSTSEALLTPIRPPDHPLQYRAIGVVRGVYTPEKEQFTRGTLTTPEGNVLDVVLLGRVMNIVRKHLKDDQIYHWVVYPRTRDQEKTLHLQIVGVWEPELLGRLVPDEPVAVDVFSIRGEVIFQSPRKVVVKIRQAPRANGRAIPFKLQLLGALPARGIGQFWDFQVMRNGHELTILDAISVAELPQKPKFKPRRATTPPVTANPDTPKPVIKRKSD